MENRMSDYQRALKFCRQSDGGYADCMAAGIDEATWRAALAQVRAEQHPPLIRDGADALAIHPPIGGDFWGQR